MQSLTLGEQELLHVIAYGDDPGYKPTFRKECRPSYIARRKAEAEHLKAWNERHKVEDDAMWATFFKELDAENAVDTPPVVEATGATPEEVDAPPHPLIDEGIGADVATLVEVKTESPLLPPVADPAPIKGPVASDYRFPACRLSTGSGIDFREALEALTKVFNATKDYGRVRDEFCSISLALNEQGLWAPSYRPQPRLSPFAKKTPVNLMLHKDHLIIDAHWLWSKQSTAMFSGKYDRLLGSAKTFDFELACEYAGEEWTSDYRAGEHFCLPSEVQWQLCTTRSKMHIEQYHALVDGVHSGKARTPARICAVKRTVATWARINHRIRGEEQAYTDLWLSREMLGIKAAAKEIAELAGFMRGHVPLDASTVRNKLKGLDSRFRMVK